MFFKRRSTDEEAAKKFAEQMGIPYQQALDNIQRVRAKNCPYCGADRTKDDQIFVCSMCGRVL